jgi:hypothetical protein
MKKTASQSCVLSNANSNRVVSKEKRRDRIEDLPIFGFKLATFFQSFFACSGHEPRQHSDC